jgi:hypothetical protein
MKKSFGSERDAAGGQNHEFLTAFASLLCDYRLNFDWSFDSGVAFSFDCQCFLTWLCLDLASLYFVFFSFSLLMKVTKI